MHRKQTTYIEAKAAYDAAVAQKHAALNPYTDLLDSDEGIEQYTDLDMKFHEAFQCDTLYAALRNAEDEMIDWAIATVQRSAAYNQSHHGDAVQTVLVNRRNRATRTKLIDLAFRLAE